MEELKAISQNLLHSNIGITDGIFCRLPDDSHFMNKKPLTSRFSLFWPIKLIWNLSR